jgi:hypothetical protein
MIERYAICRDDDLYLAWPDVALTPSGRLVCVFAECTHHGNRDYTRIMVCHSDDRGRMWTPRRAITEPLRFSPNDEQAHWWNCPRITQLADGRLAMLVDRSHGSKPGVELGTRLRRNWLFFSGDQGQTWDGPVETPALGIVPDRLIELRHGPHAGRWILTTHARLEPDFKLWQVRCWLSDDRGATWSGPCVVAEDPGLLLCEGSVLHLASGELVCFMRENSFRGLDAYKTVSTDGGRTWTGLTAFPLPGCHRPVAGLLQSGLVLITHRFMQGGQGWVGWWTQNFFAALTDAQSCLALDRSSAHTRILPVDFDRSAVSDTGYSGWVQFDDGDIYIVNYIVDDAPKGQIRGYVLRESDFLIST